MAVFWNEDRSRSFEYTPIRQVAIGISGDAVIAREHDEAAAEERKSESPRRGTRRGR
jgi:hypothetical protein